MSHLMLDLETLGTTADAVVLSIGVVVFDPRDNFKTLWEHEYVLNDITEQTAAGRVVDTDTLRWWFNQSDEARDGVSKAMLSDTVRHCTLAFALRHLHDNLNLLHLNGVWGNGSDFDNAIMMHAASKYGSIDLWPFYLNRCFRTFTNTFDPEKNFRPAKNNHRALDDCHNQILWMRNICADNEQARRLVG